MVYVIVMQCVGVMYEVRFYTGWRKSALPNLHKVNLHHDTRKKYYTNVKVKWSCYRPGVAQRVCRGTAVLFYDRGTRRGWVVSSMPRPHFTPGKDPIPIVQEAGWAPGPVWMGGKSRLHRDSIPDRPALSQYYTNISLLKHGVQVRASCWLRKCSKCLPWEFPCRYCRR